MHRKRTGTYRPRSDSSKRLSGGSSTAERRALGPIQSATLIKKPTNLERKISITALMMIGGGEIGRLAEPEDSLVD